MIATAAPNTNRPLRRKSVALIIAIIGLVVLGIAPVATAQSADQTGHLQLLNQTDWVTEGKSFDFQLRPTTNLPADQVEIVATVYGAVRSRSQFDQSIDNKISGTSIILDRHPLNEIMATDGTATISLPVQDSTQKRYYLRNAGIYPLKVELRSIDSGDVLDQFVTHILNEPQQAMVKLGVTTVLPVQSPQSLEPENPLVVADNGASLQVTANALAAHPSNPVALVAEPESIDRLEQAENETSTAAVTSLAGAQANRQVLRTTWTPTSSSLYEKDLSAELNLQFKAGQDTLNRTFSQVTTNTWAATEPLDANGLEELKNRGVDRFIVREQDLTSSQRSTTLTRPFALSAGKGKNTFNAAMADSGLADHFADADGPVLGAHRLLADLAVLYNDRPANQRTVVIMPSRSWNPNADFLEILLHGTENSPLVSPASIDTLFSTPVEGGSRTPLTLRTQAISKVETQGFPANDIKEQRQRLNALSTIATGQNQTIDELNERLLLAQRADLDTHGHKQWVDSVKNAINKQLGGIHLPKERSIRLTARNGEIPVTVQNDNGYPVQVRVRLTANKLNFPDGDVRTIDTSRQYVTERFAVETRTSGAFGVQVQLESPDGSVVLQKSEITVRSTATSAVGVGLSVGAIAFLILWWIRSTIKSRRKEAAAA